MKINTDRLYEVVNVGPASDPDSVTAVRCRSCSGDRPRLDGPGVHLEGCPVGIVEGLKIVFSIHQGPSSLGRRPILLNATDLTEGRDAVKAWIETNYTDGVHLTGIDFVYPLYLRHPASYQGYAQAIDAHAQALGKARREAYERSELQHLRVEREAAYARELADLTQHQADFTPEAFERRRHELDERFQELREESIPEPVSRT